MTDLGDIGRILDSEPLADLEWLEIDKDTYHALERLPKQNLNAIPELEEQWSRDDDNSFRLSAENKEYVPTKEGGKGESVDQQALVFFARRLLQAGMRAEDVVATMQANFDAETLRENKSALHAALQERGLLGNVYIDSRLYRECYKGAAALDITASNKKARYVLGKSECYDCIHNTEGRCAVLKKEITFEVVYDEDLWREYEGRFRAERKDLNSIKHLPVEARLQRAFLSKPLPEREALDNKPREKAAEGGISYSEAMNQLKTSSIRQEVVEDVRTARKVRRVAQLMMEGGSGEYIRDLITTDPDLATLRNQIGVLGHLYLDLGYYATYGDARRALRAWKGAEALVVGTPYEEREGGFREAGFTPLDVRSSAVVEAVYERLRKVGGRPAKEILSRKMRAASDVQLWRFIQSLYNKPLPADVREYETQEIYDPTEGISDREAAKRLGRLKRAPEVLESRVARQNKEEVVRRMLEGDHGKRVAALIRADKTLNPLRKHLHLMGRLYVDTEVASASLIRSAAKRNPELLKLPEVSLRREKLEFLKRPEVLERVAERLALVKGLEGTPARKYTQKVRARLGETDSERLYVITKKAFAAEAAPVVAVKETPYRSYQEEEITESEVRAFEERIKNRERGRAYSTIEDYAREEGGRELMAALVRRLGLDAIRRVFMGGEGKIARTVVDARSAATDMKAILTAVMSPDFKPSGMARPTKRMFQTKMGRFLRDQYAKGRTAAAVVEALQNAFSYADIVENAPVIVAFREEEGLYGRVYSTADSYDDCNVGANSISTSIQQIVAGTKCNGCVYNKMGRCLLYAKPLVETPEYGEDTVRAMLQYRISRGQLTERDAKQVLASKKDAKEKTRFAGMVEPSQEPLQHVGGLTAYYGQPKERALDDGVVREEVAKRAKAAEEALAQIQDTTEGGVSGYKQMAEFELGARAVSTLGEIEIEDEPEESGIDVEIGNDFILS